MAAMHKRKAAPVRGRRVGGVSVHLVGGGRSGGAAEDRGESGGLTAIVAGVGGHPLGALGSEAGEDRADGGVRGEAVQGRLPGVRVNDATGLVAEWSAID